MSEHASPPAASINIAWVNTTPRSCVGVRSPAHGIAVDEAGPKPDPVSETTQRMQACVGHDLCSAGLHDDVQRTVTVHFAVALPLGTFGASTPPESLTARAFARIRDLHHHRPVNDQG